MTARPQRGALARPADVDLRSAPRIVGARAGGRQSLSDVSRAGEPAGAVREGDRLHAHRAAAGDGASVFGLLGLPGARVLRADEPLRAAGRLQVLRRRLPSGGARRHSRLGARTFPEGRARPRAVRRHRAVRARGPAAGRASGLGHADLQLRPQRGAQLPAVERAVLARGISRRRAARRRRGVDAVSGLLAPRRRVDSEPVRRAREPRGDHVPAAAEHADARRHPRHDHRGRGIDRRHRASAGPCISAASASPTSGTWAGCTTCSSTCTKIPFTAAGTTTS